MGIFNSAYDIARIGLIAFAVLIMAIAKIIKFAAS